jgi:hypothetical protein
MAVSCDAIYENKENLPSFEIKDGRKDRGH